MAGDWIPMRLDLAEDPAVIQMAEQLGIREEDVVGRLHKVWSWASRQCHDGTVTGVTLASLGRVLALPDFLLAMRDAGWIAEISDDDGTRIEFPKWDSWLGSSAKKRLKDAERQRRRRHADVTNLSRSQRDKSATTEEKRREQKRTEEKKENTKTSARSWSSLSDSLFNEFWSVVPRKTKKKDAEKAFTKAVREVSADRDIDPADAAKYIIERMMEFAASEKAKSEFCPYPATWLNSGSYDDDPAEWKNRKASKYTTELPDDLI